MLIERTVLDEEQKALIAKIDAKMDAIQRPLDDLNGGVQVAMESVSDIRQRIAPLKAKLSSLAALKASIASKRSRAKYFPNDAEFNERLSLV